MIKVTDYKNPIYSAEGTNQIDLEILTDVYGWIPTTILLDNDDKEPHTLQIKEWLVDNVGSIEPYIAPTITTEQKISTISSAVQVHIDTEARSKGYDNINSIAKYMGYTNDFQTECETLGAWTASCWSTCHVILSNWEAGNITEPTADEVIAQLPTIVY